jgi:hypothetical protein
MLAQKSNTGIDIGLQLTGNTGNMAGNTGHKLAP